MQTDYANGLLCLEFVTMKIKHYKSFRLDHVIDQVKYNWNVTNFELCSFRQIM